MVLQGDGNISQKLGSWDLRSNRRRGEGKQRSEDGELHFCGEIGWSILDDACWSIGDFGAGVGQDEDFEQFNREKVGLLIVESLQSHALTTLLAVSWP